MFGAHAGGHVHGHGEELYLRTGPLPKAIQERWCEEAHAVQGCEDGEVESERTPALEVREGVLDVSALRGGCGFEMGSLVAPRAV